MGVSVHGHGGVDDILKTVLNGGIGHPVGGYPQFDGYPDFNMATGQQVYVDWLERSWLGGQRVVGPPADRPVPRPTGDAVCLPRFRSGMARTAKDVLVRLLSEGGGRSADSATLTLPADVLVLGVESVGEVSLSVRPAQVKQLLSVARPAHFGKGEETLLDPSVRDTWEITPAQVTLGGARWEASLHGALQRLGAEIGLPATSRLRPELHSMLVYGKGQFFAPHQDSPRSTPTWSPRWS